MFVDQKILQWLETELFEGRISLGQDLPDDREISEIIRSSHHSTREALKRLETMGVLRLYEGKRKTIIPHLVSEPASALAPALRLHMAEARYPTRDMVQTRIMLETWALQHAQREHPAMDELRQLMEAMQADAIMPHDFHRYEVDFHLALTKLADNHLVTGLMSAMRGSIEDYLLSLMGKVPLWSATAARLRAEHQAIFDAVKSGDNELAQQLVISSIEQQYAEAGIELDAETEVAHSLPGSLASLKPIEIDTDDLIPDEWDEAVSPEIISALENILPISPAKTGEVCPETGDEQDASAEFSVQGTGRAPVGDGHLPEPSKREYGEQMSAHRGDFARAEPTVEDKSGGAQEDDISLQPQQPLDIPAQSLPGAGSQGADQRSSAAYSEVSVRREPIEGRVLRASEAGAQRVKKRKGQVSTPVYATVIKPIDRSQRTTGMIAGQVPSRSSGELPRVGSKKPGAQKAGRQKETAQDRLEASSYSVSEHESARRRRLAALLEGKPEEPGPVTQKKTSGGVASAENHEESGHRAHSINKKRKKRR